MAAKRPSRLSPERAALLGRLGAYAVHSRGLTDGYRPGSGRVCIQVHDRSPTRGNRGR